MIVPFSVSMGLNKFGWQTGGKVGKWCHFSFSSLGTVLSMCRLGKSRVSRGWKVLHRKEMLLPFVIKSTIHAGVQPLPERKCLLGGIWKPRGWIIVLQPITFIGWGSLPSIVTGSLIEAHGAF